MTDKDLLVSVVENHIADIGSKFFKLGIAGQLAVKVVVRNLVDKYGNYIELFITKDGELVGGDAIFNAGMEMLDARIEKGFVIGNIKITSDDIRSIQKAFNDRKEIMK